MYKRKWLPTMLLTPYTHQQDHYHSLSHDGKPGVVCVEAISRLAPRQFRLAEIFPKPNFCQPWRKFVDEAESPVSRQLCFRTPANVVDVFRTISTSTYTTKRFSFHTATCLVSKANFTANPLPPCTRHTVETVPPVRDGRVLTAASGVRTDGWLLRSGTSSRRKLTLYSYRSETSVE